MKPILILTVLLSFFSYCSFSQKMIADDIYLYGKLDSCIYGNVLIAYKIKDPETEIIVLNRFESSFDTVYSLHDYFFPGVTYPESEIDSFIVAKNISSIIYIDIVKISTHSEMVSSTFYSSFFHTFNTFGKEFNVLDNIRLTFEVFNIKNSFKKPQAIIYADGRNYWGKYGALTGTLNRSLKRILNSMEELGVIGSIYNNRIKRESMEYYINGK